MWQTCISNEESSPLVQQQSSRVDWADCVSVCPASLFEKGAYGFSMVQECARATLASADRTPLRSEQLPGWREYSEWTHGDRSWCGGPHPSQLSFPMLHHWFPGWVTLVTLSFNLLQRAWPLEHVSWGWEQSLGYWSPNGNHRCPQLFLRKTLPWSLFWIGKLLCLDRKIGYSKKSNSEQTANAREGSYKWWGTKHVPNYYLIGRCWHIIFLWTFESREWRQFELWDTLHWGMVSILRVLSKWFDTLFQEQEWEGVPV